MDFIKAGSQIITTNSYATQPNYYMSAYGKDAYMKIMYEHAKVIFILRLRSYEDKILLNLIQLRFTELHIDRQYIT